MALAEGLHAPKGAQKRVLGARCRFSWPDPDQQSGGFGSSQVRDFQSIIGRETRAQCNAKWGGLPDIVMACVGGGSNAMGIFHEFVEEQNVSRAVVAVQEPRGWG